MKVMALDCEYNQPSRKCIQIGAAIFDAKTGQVLDRFETYVNPGEPIEPFIIGLTGIRDSHVANAPSIAEAFALLKSFHQSQKVFRNPIVWGSGVRNDSLAIWEESKTTEENFMGFRVIDAKSIYQSIQLMRNKQFAGGLEHICTEVLQIGFEGQSHSALADAMNTFRVWHYLVSRFGELR